MLACLDHMKMFTISKLNEISKSNLDNMNVEKTPSKLVARAADFNRDGYYADPHQYHFFWYQFLRLSPSYELARRYRKAAGELIEADRSSVPPDFDKVLEVFDDFGNIQLSFFRTWLIKRGLKLLGSPGVKPTTKLVYNTTNDQSDHSAALAAVTEYFEKSWRSQNQPAVMLVAVPLDRGKIRVLREFEKLLDKNLLAKKPPEKPKYTFAKKGVHRKTLVDSMSVLYMLAANPNHKLWQIGVSANISKKYSKLFDVKSTKRNSSNAGDMRTLEMLTSRKARIALNIAENAARGRFPDPTDPPHKVDFPRSVFKQIIKKRISWEKEMHRKFE